MPCNHSVIIATQQRQLQTKEPPKANGYAAIDCNRRICVANTRRMLLPHAQHRNDDVQRTYKLQQRRIHHQLEASRPNRIKSNSAREAATQASVCVSTVINAKSESNWMPSDGQHPERRYHGVNRVPCAVCHADWQSKDDGCRQ